MVITPAPTQTYPTAATLELAMVMATALVVQKENIDEEPLDPEHHPLLRPGAMRKRNWTMILNCRD